jgi:hypothetical protein
MKINDLCAAKACAPAPLPALGTAPMQAVASEEPAVGTATSDAFVGAGLPLAALVDPSGTLTSRLGDLLTGGAVQTAELRALFQEPELVDALRADPALRQQALVQLSQGLPSQDVADPAVADLFTAIDVLGEVRARTVGDDTAAEHAWIFVWDQYRAEQPWTMANAQAFTQGDARFAMLSDPEARDRLARSLSFMRSQGADPAVVGALQQFTQETSGSFAGRSRFDRTREYASPHAQRVKDEAAARAPGAQHLSEAGLRDYMADPDVQAALLADPGVHDATLEVFVGVFRNRNDSDGVRKLHLFADLLGQVRAAQVTNATGAAKALARSFQAHQAGQPVDVATLTTGTNALAFQADRDARKGLVQLQASVRSPELQVFLDLTQTSYAARTQA